jgi:hypothetical protein
MPDYGRSSLNITHFVSIHEQTWPPQAILVSDWPIKKTIFSSETAWPNEPVSYQVSVHLAKWFQRRRFLEIDQSTTIIACCGNVCSWIGTK